LREAVVRDIHLAADERLDAAGFRLPIELDHPCQGAVIGQGAGRHLEPLGLLHESRNAARPVQDRVLRVDVQVDERRTQGEPIVIRPRDDAPGPPGARLPLSFVNYTATYLVRVGGLNRPGQPADSSRMTRIETEAEALRDRALVLAAELGVDPGAWYLRMLEESRIDGDAPAPGALVRPYWELQQVTGRADLRDEWRRLADALWQGDAA